MTEQPTEQKPAINLEKLFEGGEEVTGEQLLDKQNISDENIALKTEVKDVMVIVAMEMLRHGAKEKKYLRVEKLLGVGLKAYCDYMVSHDRKGRKEFENTWVALMETNMRKKEGLADQIFGGSR